MAVTASSALLQGSKVADIIQDTANKKVPALAAIPVLGPSNPAGPLWNIDTGTGTVATHAEGAVFPAGTDSVLVQASLGWGRIHISAELTDEAIAKARLGNPNALRGLKQKKVRDRLDDTLKYIQNQMFQGSGATNNVAGLHMAVDATGTYAGINQATNSDFAALVMSANPTTPGTAAAITKKRFRDFIAAIVERSSLRQEELVFFTNETGKNRIAELYEGQVQYTSQAMLGGVKPNVLFDGLPFITVPAADYTHPTDTSAKVSITAAFVDWANPENGIHWQVLPYEVDEKVLMSGLPYGMQVVKNDTGAHAGKWVIRTILQLVVPNPKKCGVLNDVAV
jgi:hypothetical protein